MDARPLPTTLAFLLMAGAMHGSAQTSVLFIGNSYVASNDLPNTLRQLALSLGEEMTVTSVAPGGFTLYQHSTYAPTLSAITSQDWDFVVLQEQSQLGALPVDVTSTEYGALQLLTAIEANWECTYPMLYMTWGRENGDPQNCGNFPFMCTYTGMQEGLRSTYLYLATMYDAHVSPVGMAWQAVRNTHPEIDLYVDDGSHPTVAGTYLAACVFYCSLFHESCVDATFNSSLDPATAATLRAIASSTVLGEFETWNLDMPNGTDALLDDFDLGPDYVTLMHYGQGEHLWTCTNGQSFTGGTVTFTFATAGSYVVTHTYNDPCGNTDTRTFPFDMTSVGLEEVAQRSVAVASAAPGTIELRGAESGSQLIVFDAQGRVVVQERIGGTTAQVICPAGLHLWMLNAPEGTVRQGKVLVH